MPLHSFLAWTFLVLYSRTWDQGLTGFEREAGSVNSTCSDTEAFSSGIVGRVEGKRKSQTVLRVTVWLAIFTTHPFFS